LPNKRIWPVIVDGADPPKVALAGKGEPKEPAYTVTSNVPVLLKPAALNVVAIFELLPTVNTPLLVSTPPSASVPPLSETLPLFEKLTPGSVVRGVVW